MNRVARRLRMKNRLMLLVLSGLAGCIGAYLATSEADLIKTALFLAISSYLALLLGASFFHENHCVIHPYFSKKLSTDLPHTAFRGKEIAAHLDELDNYLHVNGLQSISDFGYQQVKLKKMHQPDELLKSLNFVMQNNPPPESELRLELCEWIRKIGIARNEGAFVAIHMRIADGVSGVEIDRLQGTY